MKEDDPGEFFRNRLAGWIRLGACTASIQEMGFVHTDMHKENVPITRLGYPVLVDAGGAVRINYPDDWHLLPTALMSLFSWLEDFEIAAFRFGYIQHGGPLAQLVCSRLRSEHELHSFRNSPLCSFTVAASNSPDMTFFFSADAEWRELRNSSPYGNLVTEALDIQHLDQWRSERNSYEIQNSVQSYQMYEFHYKKHLVAAIVNGSLDHLFEAILNLQELYYIVNLRIRAAGLAVLSERLASQYTDQLPDSIRTQIGEMNQKAYSGVEQVTLDQLRRIKEVNELFHWLWCLDDFEHGELTFKSA